MLLFAFLGINISDEAWATYVVGIIAAFIVIRQVRYGSKINKKDAVFTKFENKIKKARKIFDDLDSDKQKLIDELARLANNYNSQPINEPLSQDDYNKAIEEINKLYDAKSKHLSTLYSAPKNIIGIIREIEKSTLLNKKSKRMARVLFHHFNDQFDLMRAVNDELSTFNVIPPPGGSVNITSETFNNFIKLVHLVYDRNIDFRNYLDDLEIAIHNSLVRNIFGKARRTTIPNKHLTEDGIEDTRKDSSLI